MLEAFAEALTDAGIERDRIDAAWLGVFFDEQSIGKSSLPLSMALRLPNVPTTRVENLCATGTEALRGASDSEQATVLRGLRKLRALIEQSRAKS